MPIKNISEIDQTISSLGLLLDVNVPTSQPADKQDIIKDSITTVKQTNKLTSQLSVQPDSQLTSQLTNKIVNRQLKSVRLDQSIVERLKDMIYMESKKGYKYLEQDIFEIALKAYLESKGY